MMPPSQPPTLPLGKTSQIPQRYDPSLLYPIPRSAGRAKFLGESAVLFSGCDRWDCFEVSWLTSGGLPQCAFAKIQYPAHSPNMVESKSLKLYLMGFNHERYGSPNALAEKIVTDLSQILGSSEVICELVPFEKIASPTPYHTLGACIDTDATSPPTKGLRCLSKLGQGSGPALVQEQLYSHVLRSLCPVTHQPDWATVVVRYRGPQLDRNALFHYLATYRNHPGFHEDCCERIFTDILTACGPTELAVGCYFARRGGIAISPVRYRSSPEFCQALFAIRLDRQ
ncbi:MAG: NADPH-dependent 7-cyano-7-deazaguanine reductase QueF [Cyanobacteria bacterium P01_A01_bin.114]